MRELGLRGRGLVALPPIARLLAGLVERVAYGADECHAGKRGSRHGVHVQRLVVHDQLRELFHGHVAHARRLARVEDGDAIQVAVGDHDLHVELPVLAHARSDAGGAARSCAVRAFCIRRAAGRASRQCERAAQSGHGAAGDELPTRKTFHDASSLTLPTSRTGVGYPRRLLPDQALFPDYRSAVERQLSVGVKCITRGITLLQAGLSWVLWEGD